jgi:isopentenyl diphosphate isomerase/L-lactate dehydrogenase-like FMN-dependent dehydrogenase
MGFSALVVTVGTPVLGNRERDKKNDFTLQAFKEKIHFLSMQGSQPGKAGSSLNDYAHSELKAAASWEDIGWILSVTALPVWLKGICHPEDARLATTHGIAGVIVSNHGGRQLDSMPATIELLPEIISAVEGRLPVLIDGGIRRGTDVLKALALGASAIAIGRPVLWGLAVGGEAGVQSILRILRNELERAMWLCGIASIGQISRDILF